MKKKELLKLIRDLQERVIKLEESSKQQVWISPQPAWQPYISYPSIQSYDGCSDGGLHDYPTPWGATVPPTCKKCGKTAASTVVTCNTGTWTFDFNAIFSYPVHCASSIRDNPKSAPGPTARSTGCKIYPRGR